MVPSIRRGALVAGGLLCFTLAGATLAQPAQPPAGGADSAQHHWRDPATREAEHAKRLSDILQLRPEQDGALHAYLEAIKPPEGMGDRMSDRMGGDRMHGEHEGAEAMTTPQRLDHMLAHLDQMRERMAARAAATKTFYAQLSPDQQKAFDAVGDRHEHGGHGDHDGWRGHGDHGPDGHDGHGPEGPGGDTGDGPRG